MTERKVLGPLGSDGNPADSPVAYLRQRMYIVVREREKTYTTAPFQFAGREMPLRDRVALDVAVTPDIEEPHRLLMSPHAKVIDPKYVRLSGEIADRAILDALRAAYPKAVISHAYASTEAGVGFEVSDGREGFPAALLRSNGEVELRLRDGSLHVRSKRTATAYIGQGDLKLLDDEGFVDTDDMVEQKGDRCFFKGRRTGVINVGGFKVHPEEVEQVINEHGEVRMSRVSARRNPIMGDLIVAEVAPRNAATPREAGALETEILELCRARLPRHMVPVTIRFVPAIDILASGKLARRHA